MTGAEVDRVRQELSWARERTRAVLAGLDEAALRAQHSPIMSPLVWDLGHVANYEEQWLVRALGGEGGAGAAERDGVYDAFLHPRATRPALPMLGPEGAWGYAEDVRQRALGLLARGDWAAEGTRLIDGGFVWGMVAQHEQQHVETMLATRALATGVPALAPSVLPNPQPAPPGKVFIAAGPFPMGTSSDPWVYDNERPVHILDVPSFWIDVHPVTCGAYARFVEAGGYDDARWWSPAGWAWRCEASLAHPADWGRRDDGVWQVARFGRVTPLVDDEPVQHVCWYEADAYARWSGARLPTEAEWEKAATWDPALGRKRRWPWGDDSPTAARVNLVLPGGGAGALGPARVGAYPAGASAYGLEQLVGDVWEWTSSDFGGYPGFEAFPYREYSEVFFGPAYKVLRGGSWATGATAVRGTFRNWDYPIRRQIFAGFRCARTA